MNPIVYFFKHSQKFLIAALLLTVGFAGGCGQKKSIDRGTVADGVYRNDFFGFTMEVPAGMYVMPRTKIDSVMRSLGGDHTDDLSETLLFISAADPAKVGSDDGFNYNITVTAEKVPAGINNNGQYAAEALRRLGNSTYVMDSVIMHNTTLGNREFVKFGLSGGGINQDIYARLHNGYALVITGSYADQSGHTAIDDILSTITFRK